MEKSRPASSRPAWPPAGGTGPWWPRTGLAGRRDTGHWRPRGRRRDREPVDRRPDRRGRGGRLGWPRWPAWPEHGYLSPLSAISC